MLMRLAFIAAGLSVAAGFGCSTIQGVGLRRRARLPVAAVADDPEDEERKRFEAAGREAAEEAAFLDATGADDGLAAEFAKRLEQEGGATTFKIKSSANAAKEGVAEGASKAKAVGEDALDAVGSVASGLTEQQKNIAKIVFGLIAFQILIGVISSAMRGDVSV